MIKITGMIATIIFSAMSFAATPFDVVTKSSNSFIEAQIQSARGLDWKVGDHAEYKLDVGTFIKGDNVMAVKEITADGIWVTQDMNLGFAGKQAAQILFDANTGAVKKMIVNGQEQQIPENDQEIVDTKQEKITVIAGTFDAIHATLKDKDNKMSNIWVNPLLVPISGALKSVSPSQFGDVTMELKSYKKN